jgi:phenylalanyl-tRNA synthetase beta chain
VLFESAHVYLRGSPLEAPPPSETGEQVSPAGAQPAIERHHIGGLLTQASPGTWRSEPLPADYYAAKGLVEAALGAVRIAWVAEPAELPFLHPARAARIVAGEQRDIGFLGELHPLVAREWDLDSAAVFEFDADALTELVGPQRAYEEVSVFPAVVQDIAVVVPEEVTAAQVESAVRAGGGEALERVELFDLYRGEQIGEGRKSLTLRLEFRARDRTLTDDEVAELRAAIERELRELGGSLRA